MRAQCLMAFSVAAVVAGTSTADVTLNASIAVDDQFIAYVSTSPTLAGTPFLQGTSWTVTYQGSHTITQTGLYYLHVLADNVNGGPSMFIGEFTLTNFTNNFVANFQNASTTLLTNPNDWQVSSAGFGLGPTTPVDLGPNGSGPWGMRPFIDPNARHLWEGSGGQFAYFTTLIEVTQVPAPAALGLFGLAGVMGGRGRRRRSA